MNDTAKGEVLLYRTPDGGSTFEVKLQDETVWLTQKQMASLFQTERSVVTKHIRNILRTLELQVDSVCANFAHTAEDGKVYQKNYYSLDMVLSVGYRVNSRRGTEFRIWASRVLKDHIIEGYSLNEKRLKEQNQRSCPLLLYYPLLEVLPLFIHRAPGLRLHTQQSSRRLLSNDKDRCRNAHAH